MYDYRIAAAFMWKRVTNNMLLFQGFYLRATILRFLHFSWAVTVICLYQDVAEKELTNTNPFGALHVWNQTKFVWKNLGYKPKSFFFLSVLLLCNFHFTLYLQGVKVPIATVMLSTPIKLDR
jgi:hypothetical protein